MANNGLLVFVGPCTTSFEQVAAAARRLGVRTAWIGYDLSEMRRRWLTGFVPDVSSVRDVDGIVQQLRRLGAGRIVDVQTSEYYLEDVLTAAIEAGLPGRVVVDLQRRRTLADKLVVARLLAAAGLPVPAALDAATVTADVARSTLGLPLVVKGRVANAGTAVRIVGEPEGLATAVGECASFGGAMYERFVAGRSLSYAAAYSRGDLVGRDAVYLTERIAAGEGPPDRVQLVDDAEALRVGRAVAVELGGRGLVNINVLVKDGVPWVHDVNLRPWGTMLSLRAVGRDFVGDYLRALDLVGPDVTRSVLPPSPKVVCVFPSAALATAETNLLAGARMFLVDAHRYARWTGSAYVAAEGLRLLASALRARWRRLRSARPAAVA